MFKRFVKIPRIAVCSCLLVLLSGCSSFGASTDVHANEKTELSAWLTYWDINDGIKNLDSIGKKVNGIAYFGAYFDETDHLFIPDELSVARKELLSQKIKHEAYLTFVNDQKKADGKSVFKDIEVLRRVLADDVLQQKHADDIIAMARSGGYTGIEIDYERVWVDPEVGELFLQFIDKLHEKATQHQLKLRVVLEPRTPFRLPFQEGPEYVVMLYNLYGTHSEPGPKANLAFIEKTIQSMEALPDKKGVAFSTGGCLWGDNGEKKYLTEAQASALAKTYKVKPSRDKESQCMVFKYENDGVWYEVWYADAKTLNAWIAQAQKQGVNAISLWRLGGNLAFHKVRI